MKFKFFVFVVLVLFLLTSVFAGEKEFRKGSWYLTPQLALYTYAFNFGANLEYALTENIGVGGTLMFASWGDDMGIFGKLSQTLITPSAEVLYHFTKIEVAKLDVFVGAALGFSIYSFSWEMEGIGEEKATGSSGLFLSPVGGARYYFSPKTAASLKLYLSIVGDWSSVGGVVGVTFIIK